MLADERHYFGWIEVANNDRLAAKGHSRSCPTTATNMEERHCNEVDSAIGELPDFCSKRHERKKVVVGEHDSFWPARCAA